MKTLHTAFIILILMPLLLMIEGCRNNNVQSADNNFAIDSNYDTIYMDYVDIADIADTCACDTMVFNDYQNIID